MTSISNETNVRLGFQDGLFQDGGLFARESQTTVSFDQYLQHASQPSESTVAERKEPAPPLRESSAPRPKPAETPSDRNSDRDAQQTVGDRSDREPEKTASTSTQSSEKADAAENKQRAEKPAEEQKPKDEDSDAANAVAAAQTQPATAPEPTAKKDHAAGQDQEEQVAACNAPVSRKDGASLDATNPQTSDALDPSSEAAQPAAAGEPSGTIANTAAVKAARSQEAQTAAGSAAEQGESPQSPTKQTAAKAADIGKTDAHRQHSVDSRREQAKDASRGETKNERARAVVDAEAQGQDAPAQNAAPTAAASQTNDSAIAPVAAAVAQAAENLVKSVSDVKAATGGTTQPTSAVGSQTSGSQRAAGQEAQNTAAASQAADTRAADRAKFVQRVTAAFHAATDPGGMVRLKLSPPELGSLRLEVSVRDGAMHAKIEAETEAARTLLMDNLPLLRERLAAQDIKVQHFQVDLRDPGQGGLPGHAGHSSSGGDQGRNAPPPRWGAAAEPAGPAEPLQATPRIEAGRLNVIV